MVRPNVLVDDVYVVTHTRIHIMFKFKYKKHFLLIVVYNYFIL